MLPSVVDSFPIDESVYGVRGMGGNMMDWTSSVFSDEWSAVGVENDRLRRIDFDQLRRSDLVLRGGSWCYFVRRSRVSFRGGYLPSFRNGTQGFRLCRTIGEK